MLGITHARHEKRFISLLERFSRSSWSGDSKLAIIKITPSARAGDCAFVSDDTDIQSSIAHSSVLISSRIFMSFGCIWSLFVSHHQGCADSPPRFVITGRFDG